MKLEKIEDGMLIHCKTVSEVAQLVEHTGARRSFIAKAISSPSDFCFLMENGTVREWKYLEYCKGNAVTEFSDLVLSDEQEMTAKELLGWLGENYLNGELFEELFGDNYTIQELLEEHPVDKILSIIEKHKESSEEEKLEAEWVDLCRIIEIKEDGRKVCVCEEEIEKVLPFGGHEKDEIEKILKRYCMEHKGNFFATHEIVCKVRTGKES